MYRLAIFFLAYENGTGYIRDQGYHLQCDGATLHHEDGWPVEDELTVKELDLALGGLHCTEEASLLRTQLPGVRFPALQNFFRGEIIEVAEVNQPRWLEES